MSTKSNEQDVNKAMTVVHKNRGPPTSSTLNHCATSINKALLLYFVDQCATIACLTHAMACVIAIVRSNNTLC